MTFSINVLKREGNDASEIRATGKIPGVVYGPNIAPIVIAVKYTEFEKLYNEAGESTLIDLTVEGSPEPIKVLIQDIGYDPIKRTVANVDFRQIPMDKEMTATVELEFVGESEAVKTLGGTLNKSLDEVEVKCLPKDLVSSITIDLSKLVTFEDMIYIKDLVLPAGIVVTDNPDTLIAKVTAPLTEDELKKMEESQVGDVSKEEVTGKKEEEGEVAEGEEAKDKDKKEEDKKEDKK